VPLVLYARDEQVQLHGTLALHCTYSLVTAGALGHATQRLSASGVHPPQYCPLPRAQVPVGVHATHAAPALKKPWLQVNGHDDALLACVPLSVA
jgi:hypothetical protein